MQIGIVYPKTNFTEIRTQFGFGRAVEDIGFDHLLAFDHVLGAVHAGRTPPLAGTGTERDPFHDPRATRVVSLPDSGADGAHRERQRRRQLPARADPAGNSAPRVANDRR